MTYLHPLIFIFALIALAGILRRRRSWALAGLVGLWLACWPPVEWLLSQPLESRYPVRPFRAEPDIQAIVVFSAGVSPPLFERPYALADRETLERCEYAAWIHRKHPVPVLACGGRLRSQDPPFSAAMREVLRRAGVPDPMLWTEEQSRNTHENAFYGAEILRRQGIARVALVVDARSMPRAAASLRKQGIAVAPAPSHFRQWGPLQDELLPDWKGLKGNENTLHELLGLLWYRLRGWI